MTRLNKKIFGVLFFAIFATVTGVGIVVPLLPVYAHDLGASGIYIGLVFGAFALSRTLFLPYFGRLSDKKGRKPLIVTGLFAYAIISFVFLGFHSVEALIILRFVQGISSAMILPVVQAYVGDITPPGREGFTMGMFNMSLFFGLSIGPLAGGVIHDRFSLNAAFVCMGVLALGGFFLSYIMLPSANKEKAISKGKPPIAWRRLLADKELTGLFLFRFAYTSGIGIIWGFVPVLAVSEFSISSSSVGVLMMLGIFISGLFHTPMGYVADRANRKMMIIIGGLLNAYSIFSYTTAGGYTDLLYASIFFGLGGGISMPAMMAIAVQKGSQTDSMGSVMAFLTVAHSLGMMSGSILAGLMMDLFELRDAFSMGTIIMICGTVFFVGCSYFSRREVPMVRSNSTIIEP